MQSIVGKRGGKPLVIIDIAVPRDFEASIGEMDGVFLHDIDDMNLGAGTEPMLFEETEQADIPFPSFGYIIELDMLAVDRLV